MISLDSSLGFFKSALAQPALACITLPISSLSPPGLREGERSVGNPRSLGPYPALAMCGIFFALQRPEQYFQPM